MQHLWPVVIGLLIGLPSAALGYLAYRRGTRSDKAAAQATISVAQSGSITQVIDGLNKLVLALQDDNAALRTTYAALRAAHDELKEKLDQSEMRVSELAKMVAQLQVDLT